MPNGIDRASRLIEYLKRLATLRTVPVRDVTKYKKVLWLSNCPHERGVFTQAWGRNEEHNQDEWLKVQHRPKPKYPAVPVQCEDWVNPEAPPDKNNFPAQPELPTVPPECKNWVNLDDLWNKNDLPELLPEITQEIQNPDWHEDTDTPETILQTECLEDYPEVEQIWDRYVNDKWLPWMEKHNVWENSHKPTLLPEIIRQIRNPDWHEDADEPETIEQTECLEDHSEVEQEWDSYVKDKWLPWTRKRDAWKRVHKIYSALSAIRNEQLRLGEEYELVLGLGLLTWQTPDGQRVHRHLIVADALLEFEADLPKFTVRPHTEGANLRAELDMLDDHQPPDAEQTATEGLAAAQDNPWQSCVEDVIQTLVLLINSSDDEALPMNAHAAEQEYAPALILRKRSTSRLIETLGQIEAQIENGEAIPSELAKLAEIPLDDVSGQGNEPGDTNAASTNATFGSEVFFPKPYNDEQLRIVEKMQAAKGVLVQGPPGTGKSHTIANLICHLLATGQRILITAKKPRALQVLQGLLPEKLRPLCINLLSSGFREHDALEANVEGILHQMENWRKDDAEQERKENEARLRTLRKRKREVNRRLLAIRESERYPQHIAEGTYLGTASKIAEKVNDEREKYGWFTDSVPEEISCRVSPDELQSLLTELRRFTPEMREELNRGLPKDLPSPENFANLVRNEARATQEEQSMVDEVDEQLANLLATNDPSIEVIRNAFSSFQNTRQKLPIGLHPWMDDAVCDVLGSNSLLWHERLRVTSDVIEKVKKLVATADETSLEFSNTLNIRDLRDDARKLKKHMENGGKLGWGWKLLRPKPVRDRFYVIKGVKIGGHSCSTVEHFTNLADTLYVRIECKKAWSIWEGRSERTEELYTSQLVELKSLHDALEKVLALEERIVKCREAINQFPGMDEPIWADEPQIERIISSCRLADRYRAGEEIQRIESQISQMVTEDDVHKVAEELLLAIRSRNINGFEKCTSKIQDLNEQYQDLQNMDESLSKLRNMLPQLVESMEKNYDKPYWEKRIQHIGDAWRWGQARYWIKDYIRKEDVPALNTEARQIEDKINSIIENLASLCAWSFCVDRLNEDHSQHMVAWQQDIDDFGMGMGEHAAHHLHEAQRHLDECHESVPAWVMPLHRVWDTVKPARGMFDVVIVDEASQCGIEALPLFYIAKKIVIVGDDKQIRPEAIGVRRNQELQLMREFLSDFKFKNSFSTSRSLFDHGRRLYVAQQITLREHFRCMPEIIRFSNDLCYPNTPLIPLRQYGPDRLQPLECFFVEDGYAEGRGQNKRNQPEAEAIVKEIEKICGKEEYDGKTMGVVVLQGTAQAQLIESQLLERLEPEVIEDRRLVCGNPSSFQGDERDIIFLSLVAARDENGEIRFRALTDKKARRRFNVAASRAKDQMILFHSVTCNDLRPNDLRRRLLEFFQNTQPQQIAGIPREELEQQAAQGNLVPGTQPSPFDSWFEVHVALEILRKNFRVIPQYEVAGYRIDLVVEGGYARMAVECDGDYWHGPDRYDADMQRQRQLERCGWEFFRVRESAFRYNKDRALAGLWQALEARSIFPDHDVPESHENDADRDGLNDSGDANENEDEDSPSTDSENEGGQLRHPLEAITEEEIQKAIISALSKCPNQSCTLKSVTKLVLRELNRQTRGQPRLEFGRRVMQNVDALEEQGRIKKYQATNERIKLINSTAQSG